MLRRTISQARVQPQRLAPMISFDRRWAHAYVPSDMPVVKKKWHAVDVIKTLTSTMKNVAAGKLPVCERYLRTVRPFSAIMQPFFEMKTSPTGDGHRKILYLGLCTERGLCGGVGNNIAKKIMELVKKEKRTTTPTVAVYGKKGMNKLFGMVPNYLPSIDIGFGNIKMRDNNFAFVLETADQLTKMDWEICRVYYNSYINLQTFKLTQVDLYKLETCEQIAEQQFAGYEMEGDEANMIQNMREYKMACTIYHGLAEQSASEQGSRLMSMEGAVTACKEKSAEYQKIYMKLRQTKITSELTVLAAGVQCVALAAGGGNYIHEKQDPGN